MRCICRVFLPLFLMFTPTFGACDGQPPVATTAIASYLPDGRRLLSTISSDAIARTPAWRVAEANPPVAPRTAINIAEKARVRIVPDTPGVAASDWRLMEAAIVPLQISGKDERWYWQVRYQAVPRGGIGGQPFDLTFMVLMDGTLVEPEISE